MLRKERDGANAPENNKMRIQDNSNIGTAALGQTAPNQSPNSTSKGSPVQSSQTTDGLQLSNLAGSLSKIMQSDSASRAQRVAQLTAAVRSGTYQVDPEAVSRAMVDHIVATSQNAQ
jgi:flagellar biosynthesis anti-sigma factor FlgM